MTQALRQAGIPHREREPLSRHTTMGVGGEAAVMARPRTSEELQTTLRIRADPEAPHRVLGGGSNLVVADEGLDELVVNTESLGAVTVDEEGIATAEAGANLIRTVLKCSRAGWRGLESAVGIPGSVGGAAVMNAGAYGFSISEVMREIVVFDEDGERTEPPEGWRFRYRGSSINRPAWDPSGFLKTQPAFRPPGWPVRRFSAIARVSCSRAAGSSRSSPTVTEATAAPSGIDEPR